MEKKHADESGPDWWTQLCTSVKNDEVENVTDLLDKHYKVNSSMLSEDRFLSESPLHCAILNEKPGMVELLLSRDLDVTVTNLYGETPLHVACRTGNTGIVKSLLKAGAPINDKDCGECTPLFHAVYSDQPAVVDILIRAGCDLDTLNEELITPLDHAVVYNQHEIISLLLKGGCSIHKTMGVVYHPGHYANSLLFSLWANSDIDNVKIMINAGYQIASSQLQKLLLVAGQLEWDDALLQDVQKFIRTPQSLAGCCRISLRQHLLDRVSYRQMPLETAIQQLPLPAQLKSFLSLR